MTDDLREKLRKIPAVDQLLIRPEVEQLLTEFPRSIVVEKARAVVEGARQGILAGLSQAKTELLEMSALTQLLRTEVLEAGKPHLRRVINATGVVLHTNLGRAVLSQSAMQAVQQVAGGYSNLELDLTTGERGSRYHHVEELLKRLTGAEAALVVNNNAAAVLLALGTVAAGREVVVSRGQLVEIGGAFRIPEVMTQSGCVLKEVGSTNKTHLRDYRQAVNEQTGMLLKVHTSNYRVVGFTQEVDLVELVELGQELNVPVMEDIGSGFLVDLQKYGIGDEPTVQASVTAGADIVTFSGDKLLGGTQAGIIVGKAQHIQAMKKHPFTRAVRIDKLSLAALEATLREYLDETQAMVNIPTLRMLTITIEELDTQARELADQIKALVQAKVLVEVAEDYSQVGGGAMPLTKLPTRVVKIKPSASSVQEWARLLRQSEPAIITRIQDDRLMLDPRTMTALERKQVATALGKIAKY
jgi:L-seryl-tRNA(Ser) seleniumtransferase